MKIAHLSDLHISKKSRPQNIDFVRYLIEYALNEEVDHFVITGDVSHLCEPNDFLELRNLLQNYNLLDPERLTMVIGNHDIYGGVHLAEDILTFPQKCEKVNIRDQVRQFQNFYIEIFKDVYYPAPDEKFIFTKTIQNILFVGLNSIIKYSRNKNPFAAAGKIGKRQLQLLEDILSDPGNRSKTKIVLLHHHFNSHVSHVFSNKKSFLHSLENQVNKLRKKKRLIKVMKKYNVDLVMHGHLHESHEYIFNGLRFINAGGSVDRNKQGELKINLIDIYDHEISADIRTIPYLEMEQSSIKEVQNLLQINEQNNVEMPKRVSAVV